MFLTKTIFQKGGCRFYLFIFAQIVHEIIKVSLQKGLDEPIPEPLHLFPPMFCAFQNSNICTLNKNKQKQNKNKN